MTRSRAPKSSPSSYYDSRVADRVDLVIFGASGDLAQRKIYPSLGPLVVREGHKLRVIGAGRSHKSTDEFRTLILGR